jgi:2-polyprenyl-3-methyl-5-hydroxy-6-metoxy-1,4-benzoquinol methylase
MNICSIFISYRRSDGVYPAYLLYKDLVEKGYSVFMDVNSLRNGDFPDVIRDNIATCTDFILIVSPDTFSEKIICENDWVRKEISLAIQYDKNIVPLFINAVIPENLPAEIEKVKNYNGLAQFDANFIREVHSKLAQEYIISQPIQNNSKSIASEIMDRHCSIYNANYGNEFERLEIQANYACEGDNIVLEKVSTILGNDNLSVLDVGCAFGFVGKSRFAHEKYAKIVGIDNNEDCISYAKSNCNDSRFTYELLDIESETFEKSLQEMMKAVCVKSFDIIFCSLVLHHLKDPIKFIRKIRNFLTRGGYIVVRGSDDGSKLSYGDNGLLEKIINATLSQEGVSDRLNGRKIYRMLNSSGFNNIIIDSFMHDTSHLLYDDRQSLFKQSFSYRINIFKKKWENNPEDQSAKKEFDEMEDLLARFEDVFYDKNFWYCEYAYIGYAQK